MGEVIDIMQHITPRVIARTSRIVYQVRLSCGHIRSTQKPGKKSFYCMRCDDHLEGTYIQSRKGA